MWFIWSNLWRQLCHAYFRERSCVSLDGCVCIVPLCINQSLSLYLPSLSWPYLSPLLCACFFSLLCSTSLLIFTSCPTSCFLFLFSIHSSCPSFCIPQSPSTHPSSHRPKVISTGRPSMRIQCWRLRGAGSWNSSSLSSLSPRVSSHLKVSATSEVRSQAPTKGVISFLSIHVCVNELSANVSVCVWEIYSNNGLQYLILPAIALWFAKCPSIKA